MLKIYIARHGQNEDNANCILNGHRDLPLTEIGLRQAHELANGIKVKGLSFDEVYSSPLSRAHRTAEIVCSALGASRPIILDTLIERDFGVMTGKPTQDIKKLCAPSILETDTITYFLSPLGAETFPDLLIRAENVLNHIRTKHKGGSVLLVTHGDFGKMLYAKFYNLEWMNVLTKFHFGNCELLLLAPGEDSETPHVVKIEQLNH